jgi:hypothetical protein
MPEHMTRDQGVLYDHESPEAPRRRPADDWGIDESFPRVRGRRFARAQEGPARSRRRPVEDWGADQAFGGSPRTEPERAEFAAAAPDQAAGLEAAAHAAGAPTVEFAAAEVVDAPAPEVVTDGRRTIRINGRPGELSEIAPFTSTARRRPPRTVEERLAGDPTRIIAWAFVLGILLILIAILTA